jgi:hypothetical protein
MKRGFYNDEKNEGFINRRTRTRYD